MKLPIGARRALARIEAGSSGYLDQVGWIESRATRQAADRNGTPIPWFTYPAIAFLEGRVKPDWRVLEYGAGAGTLWWNARSASITAVEHDPSWAKMVARKCAANVLVVEGDSAEHYLEPAIGSGFYEAVIVDGLFREECLEAAPALLAPGGIVILDDSQREEYQPSINSLREFGFRVLSFHGPQPVSKHPGCTTIFYRENNVLAL